MKKEKLGGGHQRAYSQTPRVMQGTENEPLLDKPSKSKFKTFHCSIPLGSEIEIPERHKS